MLREVDISFDDISNNDNRVVVLVWLETGALRVESLFVHCEELRSLPDISLGVCCIGLASTVDASLVGSFRTSVSKEGF